MNPLKLTSTTLLAALVVLSSPLLAQQIEHGGFEDLPPPSGSVLKIDVPNMAFALLAEIPLPGPLPGSGPRLNGEDVEIEVAGGTAVTPPVPDAIPRVDSWDVDPEGPPEPYAWIGDGGNRRFRSIEGGWIAAERRCKRCKKGWKKKWKLRAAGNTVAPPLVGDGRVFFGTLENRIYGVKAKNGHRLWSTEVDGRASRPLVLWIPPPDATIEDVGPHLETPEDASGSNVVLVVTDAGREVIALDARTGQRIAAIQIVPAEGRFVSVPLALPSGKIAVAQQKYNENEAALRIYRLLEIGPEGQTADVNYNAPDSQSVPMTEERDGAAEGRSEGQDDRRAGS